MTAQRIQLALLASGLITCRASAQPVPPNPMPAPVFVPSVQAGSSQSALHYAILSWTSAGYFGGTFCFGFGPTANCGSPATQQVSIPLLLTETFTVGADTVLVPLIITGGGPYKLAGTTCQICSLFACYTGSKLRKTTWNYEVIPPYGAPSYSVNFTTWSFTPGTGTVNTSCTPASTWCCNNGFPACCPPPPGSCGTPGDCFGMHPTPGCELEDCCGSVCVTEPFCCDVMWDQLCVDLATEQCLSNDQGIAEAEDPVVVIDLADFMSDQLGAWPAGHPINDAVASFGDLSDWHLCQVQQIVDQTAAVIGVDPSALVILDTDGTPNEFDLDIDPDPFDFPSVPWDEDFDEYTPGTDLHGLGGWKGWDDDPAFSAPVTSAQSRSTSNAADVSGDDDTTHEYCTDWAGAWSYEAWQYIPSKFASGGGGQFAGTYFILLNTYDAGITHETSHYSVQMQFDSNDGLCKVWHGDRNNRIDVPYDTDRWVKIQIVIDLESDWTQVYYDDNLITEYTWTGGVLGNGGGSLDLAAVDLFANGSTSVYYDDLRLEPLCPGDINLDDTVDTIDFFALIGAWGAQVYHLADINHDNVVDTVDFFELIGLWGVCP